MLNLIKTKFESFIKGLKKTQKTKQDFKRWTRLEQWEKTSRKKRIKKWYLLTFKKHYKSILKEIIRWVNRLFPDLKHHFLSSAHTIILHLLNALWVKIVFVAQLTATFIVAHPIIFMVIVTIFIVVWICRNKFN